MSIVTTDYPHDVLAAAFTAERSATCAKCGEPASALAGECEHPITMERAALCTVECFRAWIAPATVPAVPRQVAA